MRTRVSAGSTGGDMDRCAIVVVRRGALSATEPEPRVPLDAVHRTTTTIHHTPVVSVPAVTLLTCIRSGPKLSAREVNWTCLTVRIGKP
jgi:hypothetical protein